jgi:hypothetical protein
MEKFRLNKTGSKSKVRVHIAVLIVLIVAAVAAGVVLGERGILNITGKAANSIPQEDFNFFLEKYNKLQDEYQGCVQEAWALHLLCKTQTKGYQDIIANLTNSTD